MASGLPGRKNKNVIIITPELSVKIVLFVVLFIIGLLVYDNTKIDDCGEPIPQIIPTSEVKQ